MVTILVNSDYGINSLIYNILFIVIINIHTPYKNKQCFKSS